MEGDRSRVRTSSVHRRLSEWLLHIDTRRSGASIDPVTVSRAPALTAHVNKASSSCLSPGGDHTAPLVRVHPSRRARRGGCRFPVAAVEWLARQNIRRADPHRQWLVLPLTGVPRALRQARHQAQVHAPIYAADQPARSSRFRRFCAHQPSG